ISWFIFVAACLARAWSAQAAAFYRERCGTSFECVEQGERSAFSFDRNGFFPVNKKSGRSLENDGGRGFRCGKLLQFARWSRAQPGAKAVSASSGFGYADHCRTSFSRIVSTDRLSDESAHGSICRVQ